MAIKGETKEDEYFYVGCVTCGNHVELSNLRWVGGVPHVKVHCKTCATDDDYKLHPPTWIGAMPGKSDAR